MNNLNNLTMKELYVIAKEHGVKNIKTYSKEALIGLIAHIAIEENETPPEVAESIPTPIPTPTTNIVTSIINTITETTNKVVTAIQKPFKFHFNHERANKGDYLTKRVGEEYIPLKVVGKENNATVLVTKTGIRMKISK